MHPPLPSPRRPGSAGITVIELLIVLSIIGLLAAVAIPRFRNTKNRAQTAAMVSDLRNLVTVQEQYFADNLSYTTDPGSGFRLTAGNPKPTITLTGNGWTAVMTNAAVGTVCAVFIGSTSIAPATKEGAPACAPLGASAVAR